MTAPALSQHLWLSNPLRSFILALPLRTLPKLEFARARILTTLEPADFEVTTTVLAPE